MKWKEFKEFVENNGVTDDFEIKNIDIFFLKDIKSLDITVCDNEFEIY